ncbi:MAG: Holliday junction resolvase RuvX [Burkholderiales bacterium]
MAASVPFTPPSHGCVIAFDFGEKRIGVAVGEFQIKMAHPLSVIDTEVNEKRFDAIQDLITEHRPIMFIVGMPSHEDGSEHPVAKLARKFAGRIGGRFNIPTVLADERLSSASAESALHEAGVHGKRQKLYLDQVAAQQILQGFFDQPMVIQ